jgi:hypothetical protein
MISTKEWKTQGPAARSTVAALKTMKAVETSGLLGTCPFFLAFPSFLALGFSVLSWSSLPAMDYPRKLNGI